MSHPFMNSIILKSSFPILYPKSESFFTVLSNEAFCLVVLETKESLSLTQPILHILRIQSVLPHLINPSFLDILPFTPHFPNLCRCPGSMALYKVSHVYITSALPITPAA